jgi:hypothetical protein
VAGGAGTDVSSATYFNGRTGTAALTASTGATQNNIPIGIYVGDEITAAALVAGDVANCPIIVAGPCTVAYDQIVLENSLTLSSVVVPMKKTVEDALAAIGIVPEHCVNIAEYENA